MTFDNNKVAIIGCGRVGMTSAYAIFLQGLANEIVLLSRDKSKLLGEKLDLEHGLFFTAYSRVKITDDYQDLADSDIVIVVAGVAQAPGESRLDLAEHNVAIIEDIISQAVRYAPQAVYIIVSNPVDILTYKAYQIAGLPKGQIFGSGTVLDSSRLRFHLGNMLGLNPKSIHAYILGEHGDSSFPVLSTASVGGQNLSSLPRYSEAKAQRAYQQSKGAADKIIKAKGATYYAIATALAFMVKNIFEDSGVVLPVSVPLHGQYGLSGVALSVPCIIGRHGVTEILEVKLSWEEKSQLSKSAASLRRYLK